MAFFKYTLLLTVFTSVHGRSITFGKTTIAPSPEPSVTPQISVTTGKEVESNNLLNRILSRPDSDVKNKLIRNLFNDAEKRHEKELDAAEKRHEKELSQKYEIIQNQIGTITKITIEKVTTGKEVESNNLLNRILSRPDSDVKNKLIRDLFNDAEKRHEKELNAAEKRHEKELDAAEKRHEKELSQKYEIIQNQIGTITKITIEKTKLQEKLSVVLAGTLVEKLEQKYRVDKSGGRRVTWLNMLEHREEEPIRFILQKIHEVGLSNDEFVDIILEVCKFPNTEVYYKILKRNFKKILLKFRNEPPECIVWCADILLQACAIMKRSTTVTITSKTTAAN